MACQAGRAEIATRRFRDTPHSVPQAEAVKVRLKNQNFKSKKVVGTKMTSKLKPKILIHQFSVFWKEQDLKPGRPKKR